MSLPEKTINNQKSAISNLKRGFTLIELLVVIAIIGILTTMVTASFFTAQRKARDAKRKTDLKAVQQALELHFQSEGRYPTSSGGTITCVVSGFANLWGNDVFQCPRPTDPTPGPIFMQQLPQDPVYQSTTGYFYNATGNFTYTLSAKLENTNDQDIPPQATLPCTPQSGRNYCVTNP